jgi:hypothetical protein
MQPSYISVKGFFIISITGTYTTFAAMHWLPTWAQELTESRLKAWHLSPFCIYVLCFESLSPTTTLESRKDRTDLIISLKWKLPSRKRIAEPLQDRPHSSFIVTRPHLTNPETANNSNTCGPIPLTTLTYLGPELSQVFHYLNIKHVSVWGRWIEVHTLPLPWLWH